MLRNLIFLIIAIVCVVYADGCADHPLHSGTVSFTHVSEKGLFYGDTDSDNNIHTGSYQPASYAETTLDFENISWLTTAAVQSKSYLCPSLMKESSCCNKETYESFLDNEYSVMDHTFETTLQYRIDIGYAYDTIRRFTVATNRVMDYLVNNIIPLFADTIEEWSGNTIDTSNYATCTDSGLQAYWAAKIDTTKADDPNIKSSCESNSSSSDGSYASKDKITVAGTTESDKERSDGTTCTTGFKMFLAQTFDRLFGALCSLEAFINAVSDAFEIYLAGLMSSLEHMDKCTEAITMYRTGLLCSACDPDFVDDTSSYESGTLYVNTTTANVIAEYCRIPIVDAPLAIVSKFFKVFAEALPSNPSSVTDEESEGGSFKSVAFLNVLVTYISDAIKAVQTRYVSAVNGWNSDDSNIMITTARGFVEGILLTELGAINGWSSPLVNLNMYEASGIYSLTAYLYTIPFAWMKFYEKLTNFTFSPSGMGSKLTIPIILDTILSLDGDDTLEVEGIQTSRVYSTKSRTYEGSTVKYLAVCDEDSVCTIKDNRDGKCSQVCPAANQLRTLANKYYDYTVADIDDVPEEDDTDNIVESLDEIQTAVDASDATSGSSTQLEQIAAQSSLRESMRVQSTSPVTKTIFTLLQGVDAIGVCKKSEPCVGTCGCRQDLLGELDNVRNTNNTSSEKSLSGSDGILDILADILGITTQQLVYVLAGVAVFFVIVILSICMMCNRRPKYPTYGAPMGMPTMGAPMSMGMSTMGSMGPPMSMGMSTMGSMGAPMNRGMPPSMGMNRGGPQMSMNRGMPHMNRPY